MVDLTLILEASGQCGNIVFMTIKRANSFFSDKIERTKSFLNALIIEDKKVYCLERLSS